MRTMTIIITDLLLGQVIELGKNRICADATVHFELLPGGDFALTKLDIKNPCLIIKDSDAGVIARTYPELLEDGPPSTELRSIISSIAYDALSLIVK